MPDSNPPPETPTPLLKRLSTLRLFTIIVLFLILAGYSVWKSERFQSLVHGVSQARLSEALGVPVDFETVDLRLLPPSVSLVNVRVGNDPKLGLPEDHPLLTAEQISIGGGRSLAEGELRLGRIRALRPKIFLAQLPDGRWNLPPGLARPTRNAGGVKVRVGSLLVQEGILEFAGRKVNLDGSLEDFAAEVTSTGPDRYRGVLVARRSTLRLPRKEPIVAALSLRFAIDEPHGITVDDFRMEGAFGRLVASGAVEDLAHPRVGLFVSGELKVAEVERVFHSGLGFEGDASVRARLEVPPSGGFRVTGSLRVPRARRPPFLIQDVVASVVAEPEALVAKIEHARYAGGQAQGVFRIAALTTAQQPMTISVDGDGISLEGFFADLGLPGTGLSGEAALRLALRWGEEGITHASGGGRLDVRAGSAVSQVRGRFGIPTEGGGPLVVTRGRIGFENCALRFPHGTVEFTGGIPIGDWQPDFDFHLRSRDFTETDRIFQNFVAASGGKAAPLGLGGSGEIAGHLGRTWANPEATAQVTAEDARYGGVLFGSARGTVDMSDGAFLFRPLRVYEGDATLSLEGRAAYRSHPGKPDLDLVVSAKEFPLPRLLKYLDLDLPIDGRLTGSFPLFGSKTALTGGGSAELDAAHVWGQAFDRVTGRAVLTPGRFALEEVRAPVGGGMVGGSGAYDFQEKRFEVRMAGDDVSLGAVEAFRALGKDVAGKASFQVSGSGALERPDLMLTASLAQTVFFGHAIPEDQQPAVSARVEDGKLEGELVVGKAFRVTASGEIFREGAPLDVRLEASSLPALMRFTPMELPEGYGGAVDAAGTIVLPSKEGEWPSGRIRVTKAVIDLPGRPAALHIADEEVATLDGRRLTLAPFSIEGEGTAIALQGWIGLGDPAEMSITASGPMDPALVALVLPDLPLNGRLRLAVTATGPIARPRLTGEVSLADGKYRMSGISQIMDNIEGTIRFDAAGTGSVEARAKVGGGDASVAGTFGLDGLALKDFRLTVQGRRVTLRYPEDLRLVVDADLVATGGPTGNLVRGEVVLQRGTYSRDFDLTLSDLLAKSRPTGAAAREPWKDRTRLEIHVVSSQALEVRNNLARLTGTVDLVARGTLADPTLVGQVTLDEGGRVTFRDVRYEIESGTVTFASARGLAPILDVRARAEVRGYDIAVNVAGSWPRLETTFSSDPPLPDADLVNLLLTGAAPGGSTTTDVSGTLASTAGSIVGSAATGVLTRPAQKLFKLERFQIDPIFTSSGLAGATTTVGKQISPNWSVTYSQPLFEAGSREPVVEVEGRISQTWVLRLRHDENNVYLIDLRRRTRS